MISAMFRGCMKRKIGIFVAVFSMLTGIASFGSAEDFKTADEALNKAKTNGQYLFLFLRRMAVSRAVSPRR